MTIESTRIATHAATLWCRRAHLALLEVPECKKGRLDFDDDRDGIACMGSLRAARSALVDYALVRFVLIHRAVDTVVRLSTSKSSTSLPAHVPLLVDMTLTRRVVASR